MLYGRSDLSMEQRQDLRDSPFLLLAWLLAASPLTLHLPKGGIFLYALLGYGLWALLLIFDFSLLNLVKLFLIFGVVFFSFFKAFALALFWQLVLFAWTANEKRIRYLSVSSILARWYGFLRIGLLIWMLVYLMPFLFLPLPQSWFTVVFYLLPLIFFFSAILERKNG